MEQAVQAAFDRAVQEQLGNALDILAVEDRLRPS